MSEVILELKNIHKEYYQGRSCIEVLKNIDLTVNLGETVSIIGASGSGKSTLLHIAGLLDTPDSGEVQIAGYSSANLSSKQKDSIRLNELGFIYQYHHLLRDFTALENVALPQIIAGKNQKDAELRAEQLLADLGLEHRLHNFPGELSGGEQQRVAICRAMANKPKIIFADEPTGNLDPETAEQVFDTFLNYSKTNNYSVIMVTHNYDFAGKMMKQYSLKKGIISQGV